MMNTGDGEPESAIIAGDRLNRIVKSLTVVHAQIQLLQRRIERGQEIERDGLRQAMARMDRAMRALVDEIRALDMVGSPTRRREDEHRSEETGTK